jgi:hypothetical protein
MNDTIKDGGPAFPTHSTMQPLETQGMTLRDYFAGQALAGILANSWVAERFGAPPSSRAHDAYEFADAMLAEQEKTKAK